MSALEGCPLSGPGSTVFWADRAWLLTATIVHWMVYEDFTSEVKITYQTAVKQSIVHFVLLGWLLIKYILHMGVLYSQLNLAAGPQITFAKI